MQGFPDEFVIPVSNSQAYKQFGNSVTVSVIEAIAQNMLESMEQIGMLDADRISQDLIQEVEKKLLIIISNFFYTKYIIITIYLNACFYKLFYITKLSNKAPVNNFP